MSRSIALVLSLALALGAASCGDDDGSEVGSAATPPTSDDADVTSTTGDDEPDESAATELPEDVCALVDGDVASEAIGGPLTGAVADGGEVRRTCVFPPMENDGIGVTIGVQSGDGFDDKAATSERALGPGEPVEGLGDRALSFYDDEDIPEGIGGTLVAVGDLTIDVSVQGLEDEAAAREASDALARSVVEGL